MRSLIRTFVCAGLTWAGFSTPCVSAGGAHCVGDGDLDGDGAVAVADHSRLASCLAGPEAGNPPGGCAPGEFILADIDGDDDTDLRDVRAFQQLMGRAYFSYGLDPANQEAELLAMALTGAMRAPRDAYERIVTDLAAIRSLFPQLNSVVDAPDFVPTDLIVDLITGQPLGEYKALNEFYLLVDEDVLFGTTRVLTFCSNLNAPVLAALYAETTAVNYAEPNWLVGADDAITVDNLGGADAVHRYRIDDGFLDCFDGCDCHRVWVLDVNIQAEVTLVSYEEFGMPWCDF